MKKVSMKEFKENLTYWTELAKIEGPIVVTKHNTPYVWLVPPQDNSLHVGSHFQHGELKSLLKGGISGWQNVLEEDRNNHI